MNSYVDCSRPVQEKLVNEKDSMESRLIFLQHKVQHCLTNDRDENKCYELAQDLLNKVYDSTSYNLR